MLEIKPKPLSVITLANILPHCGLSCCFVDGFFCCTEAFDFDVVSFVYFLFGFHCPRSYISEDNAVSEILLSVDSSRLMFKSFIHK